MRSFGLVRRDHEVTLVDGGIVDNMPVQSIMKLHGGNGATFKRRFIPLGHLRGGGAKVSLNDVENRIIRPGFREPRIHFALVCAAVSCPPLRSDAYRPATLNRQLEQQTRRFIRNSKAKHAKKTGFRTRQKTTGGRKVNKRHRARHGSF